MPHYFAFGANMALAPMAQRCPNSRALGVARLPRHRVFITADGYASVARDARAHVQGVLWDLALADVAALDRFEGVDRGLYGKMFAPVILGKGRSIKAMIYVGSATTPGAPRAGYIEAILAAAQEWNLPPAYCAILAALGGGQGGTRAGPRFENFAARA